MALRSLSWRIGLPFVVLVLAGSVALVFLIERQVAAEQRARFVRIARTNAAFLERTKLPKSENLAGSLQQVLGVRVAFRTEGRLVRAPGGEPDEALVAAAADGTSRKLGNREVVAVPLDPNTDLILARPVVDSWRDVWRASTFTMLGVFWMLAAVVGWVIGRGFVRPLRNLAMRLPEIESAERFEIAETARADEIGDLARAFDRTRAALQQERANREQAEKLAVLGRMTAALAHEIQNPVAAIQMHAQLWRGSGGADTARLIEHEAGRIDDLLSQWLFLSRPEPPQSSVVDLATLLEEVVAVQRPRLEHARVEAQLVLDERLETQGDAKRLSQVLRNVVVNAMQAMPRGGRLAIRLRRSPCSDSCEVSFADNGRGFSEDALARFAEFFFSEKEGGMGIGLSVASEVVTAHGGELRAANRPEGGACVTIVLPLVRTVPPAESS